MRQKLWQNKILIVRWGFVLILFWMCYDMAFNSVNWRFADRSRAGIAPKPAEFSDAVVQVYAARTYNWRGYFAVHSWIAVKSKNAQTYTTYQVVGFYLWRNRSAVDIQQGIPDKYWYGNKPELLADLRGKTAEDAIPLIDKAAKSYPYPFLYHAYPGPNSNTFISYIIRQVPQLKMALPNIAIGKDFLGYTTFFAPSESKTGWQFSFYGILGITIGFVEGLEVNLLGLNFGVDFLQPALKIPFWGRIGMSRVFSEN